MFSKIINTGKISIFNEHVGMIADHAQQRPGPAKEITKLRFRKLYKYDDT